MEIDTTLPAEEILVQIHDLVAQSNQLQLYSYSAFLVCIGVVGATGVCILLYNFLRKFF